MRMQTFFGSVALGLALVLTSANAQAVAISFTIEPTSELSISLTTQTLGEGSGSADVSGTVDADLTAGDLTVTNSDINVGDITTSGSGTLGTLNINGVHNMLISTAPATDAGGGVFNLEGWELQLDEGTVFVPAFNLTAFDFSTDPLALALPEVLSTLDDSGSPVTWTIPVNAVVSFFTLANTVTVTVSGMLDLTAAPEPGAPLLVAAGLAVGLFLTSRKRA